MDGIINIYKERGYTSHDVVARMRGILKQKKIGHTGTLDPEAVGVLPVCVGAATKLCDLFTDQSKTYEAVLRLGITTDTEDMTGAVLLESDFWKGLTDEEICKAVYSFVGEYDQVPPMYSALKVNGKKLYEYARKGVEIKREPRRVHIYGIRIISVNKPCVRMRISCSKGTYIRTLCADIGEKLGCGGCMQELTRTRVGDFLLEDSITLKKLTELCQNGGIDKVLMPVDYVFKGLYAGVVSTAGERFLMNGNPIAFNFVTLCEPTSKDEVRLSGDYSNTVRMYDVNKHFIGLYDRDEARKLYVPRKLFFAGVKGGKG